MTEQLALEESQWDGRAIQLHEGPFAPPAVRVDGLSYELFAGTCFTFDENCGVRGRDGSNLVHYSPESRAGPDNVFKSVSLRTTRLYISIECDVRFVGGFHDSDIT